MTEPPMPPPTAACAEQGGPTHLPVTVLGSTRSADLALAADRPVALLLPLLVDLLEAGAVGACGLYADDGRALDPECSLAESGTAEGAVLRILPLTQAPPAPKLADLGEVAESVTGALAGSAQRWRGWVMATAGTAMAGAGAGFAAASPHARVWLALTVAAGLLGALSLLGGLWGGTPLAWTGAAGSAGLLLAGAVAAGWNRDAPLLASSALVLGVLAVDALPATALRAAGVAGLDAHLAGGGETTRADAVQALHAGHAILLRGLLACAAVVAVAAAAVGRWAPDDPWATALLAAALATWACRVRHFPHPAQKSVITAAAVAGLLGWSAMWGAQHPSELVWVGLACAAAGVALAALSACRPTPLAQAKGRRWVGRVESMCVLALVPLLMGQGGVYADLLASQR
ncbi:MAG TPA: EsaB/YukD family protein [Ornithinimicrobium sp.]|uniref:EsaB/YukD family protein n=1 Tax=Ornithinimicrobium sp. TaxID=1977084 RepID=UPI002B46B024|nr:EsaB/YukD family protein [Ornithinimicrobium sp.]HKJ12383.1 EsaB/YukD family protein [Ornithinimicrobium sp.]